MCDPATAIAVGGMALSAAGAAKQSSDQAKNVKRAVEARNSATEAELVRQRAFQADADAAYRPAIQRFEGGSQAKQEAQSRIARETKTQAAVADGGDYSAPTTGSAPSVVKTEIARKMHDAMTSSRSKAQALGKLNSWGDVAFQNNRALNLTRGRLGAISQNAAGSANLLDLDQRAAANNSQKAISGLGPAMQLAGQAAGLYGVMGAPGLDSVFGASKGLTAPNNAAYLKTTPGTLYG